MSRRRPAIDERRATAAGFDEDGAAPAPARRRAPGDPRLPAPARRAARASTGCSMRKGEVLYVGKARNLKKRVAAYAKPIGHNSRIARMIAATASMMFLTTETETEALLLEQNLIKQLKPRYNVLLRDDKSFPNIHRHRRPSLPADQEAPRPAQGAGALLRAVRLGGQREPDAEPAAEGVPAALLLGPDVREPDAALPAAPDQALQRALRRADRRGGLRGAGRGRGAVPVRAGRPGCRSSSPRRWPRRAGRWSSSAPRRCATASGR